MLWFTHAVSAWLGATVAFCAVGWFAGGRIVELDEQVDDLTDTCDELTRQLDAVWSLVEADTRKGEL